MMDPCSLVSNREVCEVEWRGKGVGNREGRKEESRSGFGYNTGASSLTDLSVYTNKIISLSFRSL
jgi:hypothetical protein